MNKQKFKHLPLSIDIYNLNTKEIEDNLFAYSYHSRYLKKLNNKNIDKEDVHYMSTYSSFVGEVYENIIYELLLRYAYNNQNITQFVLKGPHQNGHTNDKNGLLIDRNNQIVYKSGYKDVSEFDGLFFMDQEVWFVESTIVKTTASLKKRLKKKSALLKLLFPKYTIRSLIILSEGVIGASTFPSYCTVWITKQLNDEDLINRLMEQTITNEDKFKSIKDKKFIQTKDVTISTFKYFETLSWILKEARSQQDFALDFKFLRTDELKQYFDIFTKLYIGFIDVNDFKSIYPSFDFENIDENKVIVTIEKQKDIFSLIYYVNIKISQIKAKLKKIEIEDDNITLKISDKDPKGFTVSEVKFMKYIWKPYYRFSIDDIAYCNNNLKPIIKQIYTLSDKSLDDTIGLPIIQINYIKNEIDLSEFDALIFTSKNGVLSLDSFNDQWKQIQSYAISYHTAKIIKKLEGNLVYTGKAGHGNQFAKEIIDKLQNKKVLYIKPKDVVSNIKNILINNQIDYHELITYETKCNESLSENNKPPKHSIIIISSPSTLNCFLNKFGWDGTYTAIAIGHTTAKYIPEYINYKISPAPSINSCIKLAKSLQN